MNKFFAILIICSLSLPVFAISEEENLFSSSEEQSVETVINEDAKNIEEYTDNSETNILSAPENEITYKEPAGAKKIIRKFLIAMLCVIGTSVFLYAILNMYNKIRESLTPQAPVPPEGEKPLDIPSDLYEAVKTFLDKTHWDK